MIYDINSNELANCYGADGAYADSAYNINGEQVFPDINALRIMSYNVLRWEGDNSMTSIQDIAFGIGAKIVGIQEWGTTTAKTINGMDCATYLGNKGYNQVLVTSSDYNHKAVASKIAMSNISETVYSASHETRSYQKMYFTYGGKTIALFNTHTDWQLDNYKYNQIAELLDAVENEEYFILVGDLNTTCTNKEDAEYIKCVQPFIDEGYNVANSAVGEDLFWTFYNGTTAEGSTQITPPDNIITSSNIDIVNVFVDTTKLTYNTGSAIDHIPLIADIVIN